MDDRYSLRFENGERSGDKVPIPRNGFTIGRRPGNTLQILDASVSAKHAEIVFEPEGVLLRDLGSTNGTRVAGQRVLQKHLAHGDRVAFGNVQLSFLDATLESLPPDPTSSEDLDEAVSRARTVVASNAQVAGEAVGKVSLDSLARSKRRSRLGLLGVAFLALAGGGAWYFLQGQGGSREPSLAVTPVPQNLLSEDYSFEGEDDSWSAADAAPASFFKGPAARAGESALAVDLAQGEWAMHRSGSVRVSAGRRLEALAYLRLAGDVRALVGIEFQDTAAEGEAPEQPTVAWGALIEAGSGWQETRLDVPIPPGYEEAAAVVRAWSAPGEGEVRVDDVSLVQTAGQVAPTLSLSDFRFYALGDTPAEGVLFKLDRMLITGLHARSGGSEAERVGFELNALEKSVELGMTGSQLELVMNATRDAALGGVSTIGEGGYRAHGASFERESVTSLLLGKGQDLVRFKFSEPRTVRASSRESGMRLSIPLGGSRANVTMQLDFREERRHAEDLAHSARGAEADGDLGGALHAWADLLGTYPYEEALVLEAESTRSRLVGAGLEKVRVIAQEVEGAKFFQLADLFEECRERALAVGQRYASSEVEDAAFEVVAQIDQELSELEIDRGLDERARLKAIQSLLEASESPGLASRLREYRREHFPDESRDSGGSD